MIDHILAHVLPAAYAVLPEAMWTRQAARLILAVGLQSTDFRERRIAARTLRRGFWLLEPAHVSGILKFTKGRGPLVAAAHLLGYPISMMERGELAAALEHNDTLGFVVARCLLPPHLEALDGAEAAWRTYTLLWLPKGAAAVNRHWDEHYAAADRLLGPDAT